MASVEQLKILRNGVNNWNQWRENNPQVPIDLSQANLSNENLTGVNLSVADLIGANLVGTNLMAANLSDADLSEANLKKADLSAANLTAVKLSAANLSFAKLNEANLNEANLYSATLREANLSEANLHFTDCCETDFSRAKLFRADLSAADFSRAKLFRGDLSRAKFFQAKLVETDLSEADLSKAKLIQADLWNSNLNRAILYKTDFSNSDLKGTDFIEAKLIESNLWKANLFDANFTKANLSNANLGNVCANSANFKGAILTGACIEDWKIDEETNLNQVICDYIYLNLIFKPKEGKLIYQERRPYDVNRSFIKGEFSRLFQLNSKTVELFFDKGVDWKAFLITFEKLKIHYQSEDIFIHSFENQQEAGFIIRLNVPAPYDKIEFKEFLKNQYQLEMELETNNEQLVNLMEITKYLADSNLNPALSGNMMDNYMRPSIKPSSIPSEKKQSLTSGEIRENNITLTGEETEFPTKSRENFQTLTEEETESPTKNRENFQTFNEEETESPTQIRENFQTLTGEETESPTQIRENFQTLNNTSEENPTEINFSTANISKTDILKNRLINNIDDEEKKTLLAEIIGENSEQPKNNTIYKITNLNSIITGKINELLFTNGNISPKLGELLGLIKQTINLEDMTNKNRLEAFEQLLPLVEAANNRDNELMKKPAKTAILALKGIAISLPSATNLIKACNKILPQVEILLKL